MLKVEVFNNENKIVYGNSGSEGSFKAIFEAEIEAKGFSGPEFNVVWTDLGKDMQVEVAYKAMVSDVYAEMLNVFGTSNDVSAQATASTYEAMVKRPANYVGNLGLVDEAAVMAYANSKIAEADTYAVFRMNRLAQYQAEKEAIINA